MPTPTPVVFIHGLWLHATSWQPWIDLFRDAGYDPVAPGWPGEPATVEEAREAPELVAEHRHRRRRPTHFAGIIDKLADQPGDHRPLIRRSDHREAPRRGYRRRRGGHRPRADQGCAAAAAGAAACRAFPRWATRPTCTARCR